MPRVHIHIHLHVGANLATREESSRQTEQLPLARTELPSSLRHRRAKSPHPLHQRAQVAPVEHLPDVGVGGAGERVEVFADGTAEEERVLRNDCESRPSTIGLMKTNTATLQLTMFNARAHRRSARGRCLMLMSSMTMDPDSSSSIRKRARKRLDFPAPVRPTTPTFSPARTCKHRNATQSLVTRMNAVEPRS